MIDFRIKTFITLSKCLNYTKAAEELCITQPAVTQHIKYLEQHYNTKFFEVNSRNVTLTKAGELFLNYALNIDHISHEISSNLEEINFKDKTIVFGTTLTIGEYIMGDILIEYIKSHENSKISMTVDNTETIINKLINSQIDFAIIEGLFNKNDFNHKLFKNEKFVLVSSPNNPICKRDNVTITDILNQRLIIREKGSGGRDILEKGLEDINYSLDTFKDIIEIGSINVIKNLVASNLGISFMYREAAKKELLNNTLVEIDMKDLNIEKEFNFIYIKNSINEKKILDFYNFLVNNYFTDM